MNPTRSKTKKGKHNRAQRTSVVRKKRKKKKLVAIVLLYVDHNIKKGLHVCCGHPGCTKRLKLVDGELF